MSNTRAQTRLSKPDFLGFADSDTIQPGAKSHFTILITSDTVKNEAATYSLTLQWQDSNLNDYSKMVLENGPIISSSGEE